MVLYHVVSSYHLLSAVVHKLKYKKDSDATILLSKFLLDKFPHYLDLSKIFNKVVVFDLYIGLENGEYSDNITEKCENVFRENDIEIEDYEEINVWGGHYNFGLYFNHQNIEYNYWEDGAGLMSKPEIVFNIIKDLDGLDKAEYCFNNGIFNGTASGVKERVCNFNAQKEGFDFENCKNFDIVEELSSLDSEDLKFIKLFFVQKENIEIKKDSILILTQNFANLKILSFDQQLLIYQLFIDYFFDGEELTFKPHPEDLAYYSTMFKNSKVIKDRFPSELLPVMFTNKPKCIATISSTAIENLKGSFDNTIELGIDFETDYLKMHRYYITSKIRDYILPNSKIINIGANKQIINNLFRKEKSNDKFIVVDYYNEDQKDLIKLMQDSKKNDVIVFLNYYNDYEFYNPLYKDLIDNFVPVNIKKERLETDGFYADEEDEQIFVFTKDQSLKKKLKELKINKTLNNTKLKLSVSPIRDEDFKIEILNLLINASNAYLKKLSCDETSEDMVIEDFEIKKTRFSDANVKIENMSDYQKTLRILEGVLDSTEKRITFYLSE